MANKSAIPPEHGKFREGQSGNPNGRPKGVPNTSTRLERFLSAVKRGKNPTTGEEEEFTVAELMDLQQIAKALKGDTAAWEKIIDRLEGKATQKTESKNTHEGQVNFNAAALTVEDKRKMLELLDKAKTNE